MNTYENEFYSQGYNAGVKIERAQKATRLLNRIKQLETAVDKSFDEGYEAGVEAKTDDLNNTIDKLDDEVLRLRNLIKTEQHKKDNELIPCKLCRMGETFYLEYEEVHLEGNIMHIFTPTEDTLVRIEVDFCPVCGERVNPKKSLSQ